MCAAQPPSSRHTREEITRAASVVRKRIRARFPEAFDGQRDVAGQKINVHYDDGGYAATLNWELRSWVDYEFLDELNDALESERLPFIVEYHNSYEISFEAL
jgi:hypothetical protein